MSFQICTNSPKKVGEEDVEVLGTCCKTGELLASGASLQPRMVPQSAMALRWTIWVEC